MVISGCRPSGAISTASAAAVVPPGEVTFWRSVAGSSGDWCSSSPEPETVARASRIGERRIEPGRDAGRGQAFGEQEHVGRTGAGDGGDRIDQRFVVDPADLADGRQQLVAQLRVGAAVTWALPTHTVMPRPIAAGVFGMVRTTAAPAGKWRSKLAMVRPAAIDTVNVPGPARRATGANTASMTCGLTAISSTEGGFGRSGGDAASVMPWRLARSAALGRRCRVDQDDLTRIEPAGEPARQHGPAHLARADQQQRAIET